MKPPSIKVNSAELKKREITLQSGTPLYLSCNGFGEVTWRTALWKHKIHVSRNVVKVDKPTGEYTGTYVCAYKNDKSIFSEVHIYVKGTVLKLYEYRYSS